jgi:hypothetical protein
MSSHPRLASTRLVKVPGQHRWKAVAAYIQRSSSPGEIAELLHQALHEAAWSVDPGADLVTRYRAASAASLGLATVVLRVSGYDTVPPQAPKETFDALRTLFGPDGREAAAVFLAAYEESRKKSLEKSSPATLKKSLRELSEAVEGFRTQVLEWLETTRPGLPGAPPPPPKDDEPHQGRLF